MPDGQPRVFALPRWPYLVALAVALVALVLRYVVLGGAASGAAVHVQVIHGRTGQGTAFELVLDRGRVFSLRTSLSARCEGSTSWTESWSPTNGVQVHVTTSGPSFSTVERAEPTYPSGVVGRIAFALRGTITGRGA